MKGAKSGPFALSMTTRADEFLDNVLTHDQLYPLYDAMWFMLRMLTLLCPHRPYSSLVKICSLFEQGWIQRSSIGWSIP